MNVDDFSEIESEFLSRVARIVWCTVATVDSQGRPRSRILHPIWEGPVGWIATGPASFKARHLAANPYVSLSYWDQEHQQIYADCKTSWVDDADTRTRIWNLFKSTTPPLGYDPSTIWSKGPDDPSFGVLRLEPWRVEISGLSDLGGATQPKVWHA